VARAAARNILHAAHVVFLEQSRSELRLIRIALSIHNHRIRAVRRLVAHIENFFPRTQLVLRRAMTTQTPLHLQRFLLIHERHQVHWAMTRIAPNTFRDVNTVIEKDKVGKLIHPRPLQRFARAVTRPHRLQQLRVLGPDLRVAIHAGLSRRNPGETRCLDGRVAVAAIDAQPSHMMLMTEWHWLRFPHAGVGHVRRSLYCVGDPAQSSDYEYGAKDGGARQSIRTAMKDLRHSLYEIWLKETTRSIRVIMTASFG
jgi:hypothetical protein